jgi:hypothetical protein
VYRRIVSNCYSGTYAVGLVVAGPLSPAPAPPPGD